MINFGVSERKAVELEQRMNKCNISEPDLEEKFVRSSGPGGQKVNKSSTCVCNASVGIGHFLNLN